MANPLDPVLGHHTARERLPTAVPEITNDQARQPTSTVMLKITRNILKPQAEKIIAEEQASFRAEKSTTEQIFNLSFVCEKYLQHQQDFYHVFIDLKKATSEDFFNGIGDCFRTTVGVWQGCLLSPMLFNVYLERIVTSALVDYEGIIVSNGGRTITNLHFTDDLAGEEELAKLVERLDKASTAYSMEISAQKTKLITNSNNEW